MATSAYAFATPRLHTPRPPALRHRRNSGRWQQRPWTSVSVGDLSLPARPSRRPPAYVWLLVLAAIAIHGLSAWYLLTHANQRTTPPRPQEVAVELVRPQPPPPKVEPPKPPPPRRETPQVLPPIETAPALPSEAPAIAAEAPVAVAPVVTAPPEPPPPVVTAAFGRAGYLNNPPPEYPAAALRQRWEGTVILRVHVLANGHAERVEIQKSSGRRLLDDEAVRTVERWTFSPSKRGDTAIDGWATVPIEFKLE